MSEQRVNLFEPIESSHVGPMPVFIRVRGRSNNSMLSAGMPTDSMETHDYIHLRSLPSELRERVKTAVQALISGM